MQKISDVFSEASIVVGDLGTTLNTGRVVKVYTVRAEAPTLPPQPLPLPQIPEHVGDLYSFSRESDQLKRKNLNTLRFGIPQRKTLILYNKELAGLYNRFLGGSL